MTHGSWQFGMVVAVGAALCGACLERSGGLPPEPVDARDGDLNGVELNSARINGWTLNGWTLNGAALNGWTLNGWTLNGWTLNGVALSGSLFQGTQLVDGQAVARAGLDFIGSELYLTREDQQFTLRIDDIHKNPADPTGDVYFYQISVLDPDTGTWSSLCRDRAGGPTEAIPLANYWDTETGARIDDPDAVTLACRGAVLAKCVEWGYRPWGLAKTCAKKNNKQCATVSLAEHHQACTRMARADYCGDGTPHTLNDTPIDVFDRLSPQIQGEATATLDAWTVEAEWGPHGAICVGDSLRTHMLDELDIPHPPVACLDALENDKCGDFSPTRGGLLINKFCEDWLDDPGECIGGDDDDQGEDEDDDG